MIACDTVGKIERVCTVKRVSAIIEPSQWHACSDLRKGTSAKRRKVNRASTHDVHAIRRGDGRVTAARGKVNSLITRLSPFIPAV